MSRLFYRRARGHSGSVGALAAAWLALAGAAAAGTPLTGGDVNLPRNGGARAGGEPLASSQFELNHSVGETASASFSGGAIRLHAGLMSVAAQPGSVTGLAAAAKSTGSLELAWTAPGADGFRGAVAGGFYRVDYSSDPAHAFSPRDFQLELSTDVVPGQPQRLRLEGLLPNTTYYARVYLGDARKRFAEDSDPGDESTLANLPAEPAFAAVHPSSATIAWLLPSGGAAGYQADASSTNFGGLLAGGVVLASRTADGLRLSLTVGGLFPGTTYFFKVASLNAQGEANYTTVLSTRTPLTLGPLPVLRLASSADARARSIRFTWENPGFEEHQGVLVLLSTSAAPAPVADGSAFDPGETLADASVVRSTALAAGFLDAGLALDTTYYYHLFTEGQARSYSVSVSTSVFLDLPPMAPAGLASFLSDDRSRIALSWTAVTSSDDGTPFASTAAPRHFELTRYEVSRATSPSRPSWVRVATVPAASPFFSEDLPTPGGEFLYRVAAVDSFESSATSVAAATDQSLYALAPDGVSGVRVPASLAGELRAGGNPTGSDLLVRASEAPADDPTGRTFRSVKLEVVKTPGNEPVPDFRFSKPELDVSLRYDVEGGQVVPSAAARAHAVPADDAARNLAMYWDNGARFVKLFGKVDPGSQTVSVQTALPGTYQIRSVARATAFDFDLSGVSNRAITPNGDGRNDKVVFRFDNPRDSAFSGEVFDVTGTRVASLAPGPVPNSLEWDGKAGGRAVAGGVYIYQIRAESKVFNGTVVVIR